MEEVTGSIPVPPAPTLSLVILLCVLLSWASSFLKSSIPKVVSAYQR